MYPSWLEILTRNYIWMLHVNFRNKLVDKENYKSWEHYLAGTRENPVKMSLQSSFPKSE